MIRIASLALCFVVLAAPAMAQRAPTQVSGDWITLGDVAPVTGSAAGILIGPAPPSGQTLSLDPAFLIATAKGAGVILAIPLDQPIMVTRATGNAPVALPANTARAANPARQVGSPAQAGGEILVLVRDITRGDIITANDVEMQAQPTGRALRGVGMDAAVGMEAKRTLKAGQPILATDIKAASVIRKGDPIAIVYTAPGVRLSVDGIAQNEAALGQPVRVLNTYSKRSIDAVATGHGEASVN
ncbi:MAG: flagellar basal body P-ring formation chaperone FlgA [Hyphomonadaceae bacterium]